MVARRTHWRARTFASRKRRQVVGTLTPRHVLTLGGAVCPAHCSEPSDDIDHISHRRIDAFFEQRRNRAIGDAARNDVLTQVAHIGTHVEPESVHAATSRDANANGTNLAGIRTVGVDPHTWILGEASGIGHTQLAERVDNELLDIAHMRHRVGRASSAPVLRVQRQHRVAHQLTGAVIGDITAAVHGQQFGANRGGVYQHVGQYIGPRTVGKHMAVLEQQQVVL